MTHPSLESNKRASKLLAAYREVLKRHGWRKYFNDFNAAAEYTFKHSSLPKGHEISLFLDGDTDWAYDVWKDDPTGDVDCKKMGKTPASLDKYLTKLHSKKSGVKSKRATRTEFDPSTEMHHFGFVVKAVDPGCTLEFQIEEASGRVTRITTTEHITADRVAIKAAVSDALERLFKKFGL